MKEEFTIKRRVVEKFAEAFRSLKDDAEKVRLVEMVLEYCIDGRDPVIGSDVVSIMFKYVLKYDQSGLVRNRPDLTTLIKSEKDVLSVIAKKIIETGGENCWLTQDDIAVSVGYSRIHVGRIIKRLVEIGCLNFHLAPRRGYSLNVDPNEVVKVCK